MEPCRVSIVVITHNEGKYLVKTVESLLAALPDDAEILIVDDHSNDGSTSSIQQDGVVRLLRPAKQLGTVKARNYGANRARGEVIVFSDAHIEVPPRWHDYLLPPLARTSVGAVGPVISMLSQRNAKGFGLRFRDAALNCEWGDWQQRDPYPVPMLGAGFFAMRRDVFHAMGGFDPGMVKFGMEDPDLDIRLYTFGYECLLVPSVEVAHLFRNDHAFQDWETFLHNVMRYATIHFSPERMEKLIKSYSKDSSLPGALARVAASDAPQRRREIQSARFYDDNWYFGRFGMDYEPAPA